MRNKLTLMAGLSVCLLSNTHAQEKQWVDQFGNLELKFDEIQHTFNKDWGDKEYVKGNGIKQYKRWETFWADRLLPNGKIPNGQKIGDEIDAYLKSHPQKRGTAYECIGPYTFTNAGSWAPGQGRVQGITVDPNNSNTIYIAAPAGGVWKTTDGGDNWKAIGDEFGYSGASSIAVDYNNSNIVYASTGDYDGFQCFPSGVYKSTNGGDTWTQAFHPGTWSGEILINPSNSNHLLLCTRQGLFQSSDAGANWAAKYTDEIFYDIAFKPGDPNTIYATSSENFYKSTDGGSTFTEINFTSNTCKRVLVAVTPANPDYVYIFSANSDWGFEGIYRSTNSGTSFTKQLSSSNMVTNNQAWYDMAFAVSDTDPNLLYTGVVDIYRSTNGGTSFTQHNSWNNYNSATYTHADIHYLGFLDGKFYCGSDGGIYISDNNGNSFYSKTDGLAISQFYSVSGVDNNTSIIAGGLQDNGGYVYYNNAWRNYAGADGMESAVSPANNNLVWGMMQNGGLYYSISGNASQQIGAPSGQQGLWVTPMDIDQNGVIYAGYSQVYRYSNGWTTVGNGNFDAQVKCLVVSPTNASVMVASTDKKVYRTTNGSSWSDITNNLSLPGQYDNITSVEVHNTDADKIWLTVGGFEADRKVYMTSNGGSTWTNISDGLPNVPMNIVKYVEGSNGAIYVGGDVGVYYRDEDYNTWVPYFEGLPRSPVKDIEINESQNFMRVATFGRSMWQVDLYDATTTSVGDVKGNFVLYPNPTNSLVNISSEDAFTGTIDVFNTMGQLIHSEVVNGLNKATIDLQGLNSGMYIVKINSDKGFQHFNVLKN